jgi:hypothetical protein
MKKTTLRLLPLAAVVSVLFGCGGDDSTSPQSSSGPGAGGTTPVAASQFTPGNLLVSRSTYDAANVVSGTLPFNATPEAANATPITAVTPGTFPNVFTNDAVDANFGVTSEVLLDQWAPGATSPAKTIDITALAAKSQINFATSFSSKSELALNVSRDNKSLTFVAYNSAIDQLDISNSNTPGVVDPTNNDISTPTFRTVAQLNFADSSLSFTNTNAYSGDNGRAAILANGMFYMVGNAGDSGKTPKPTTALLDTLTTDTGVQSIVPGSSCPFTQVIGAFQSSTGGSYSVAPAGTACSLATMGTITGGSATGDEFGFSITSLGQPADKTGKDNNFRGLFDGPDGTVFITKGSGGNGVNTVYQVGATGALGNGGVLPQNAAITIVPGFPTALAANPLPTSVTGTEFPFSVWIPASNPSIMFVADEGDGTAGNQTTGSGGLWVYQNQNGTWKALTHLTAGLNLGTAYTVTDTQGVFGTAGANYTTTPDGLRGITGQTNSDGSFTIFGTTSTAGNSLGANFDSGADSNQLVKITVNVSGATASSTSGFSTLQTAPFGQVLRGVAIVPGA